MNPADWFFVVFGGWVIVSFVVMGGIEKRRSR